VVRIPLPAASLPNPFAKGANKDGAAVIIERSKSLKPLHLNTFNFLLDASMS